MRDKEYLRLYHKQYREQHKEQINAYYRTYYKQNREVIGLQRKVTSAKKSKEKAQKSTNKLFRPHSYYNRVFAWVIKQGNSYMSFRNGNSVPEVIWWTLALSNARMFAKKEYAEIFIKDNIVSNDCNVVMIELREKVGEQQVIGGCNGEK